MNFWQTLAKPIFILAPMDGVTDTVFRQIVASVGRPDVFFTEFVSIDAILSRGSMEISKSLRYSEIERPIVAQIWGTDADKFYQAAKLISKLKFDGIDINMGCPDKNTIKKGACSALINNPQLAKEIILAAIKGANGLPVSVKTRIGFNKIDMEGWVTALLETPISALILHLRTVSEMSKVPAHWEEIKKAAAIRNKLGSKALIIGNGDVKSLQEAKGKCKKYNIDGIMIGRGIFENVYLFNEDIDIYRVTLEQKTGLLLKHLELFKKTWGNGKHFELMKKFVKCYVNNFTGAAESRKILMSAKNLDELINSATQISRLKI